MKSSWFGGGFRRTALLRCSSSGTSSSKSYLTTDIYDIKPTDPIGVKLLPPDGKPYRSTVVPYDLSVFCEPKRVRNFSIVAHVDHGKTTLADCILRRCCVLPPKDDPGSMPTYLDKLEVEKEHGITVKAQTATFFVKDQAVNAGEVTMLNLVDTPGHVDFSYEVSRALAACEGAVLLVDAKQGVQAQTLANMYLALDNDLPIVPCITKVDSALGDDEVDKVMTQVTNTLGVKADEVILTSAKAGLGVEALLRAVVERIPPPPMPKNEDHLQAMLFDAWSSPTQLNHMYCLVRLMKGSVAVGEDVTLYHTEGRVYKVLEVGMMYPEPCGVARLYAGQVGYVLLGMQNRLEANIGDTLIRSKHRQSSEPLPGFKTLRPVVFGSFFPDEDESQHERLKAAIEKVVTNDPVVTVKDITCAALGKGFQLGFLGMLHMQIFAERLLAEHGMSTLITPAQVLYKYRDREDKLHDMDVTSWKDKHDVKEYLEPFVTLRVTLPEEMVREINSMTNNEFRVDMLDQREAPNNRQTLEYRMSFAELTRGYFTRLKQASHGYAALEYDDPVYEPADIVKLDFLINKTKMESLSTICTRDAAQDRAKRVCRVLKENLKENYYNTPIQAVIGGKIICRETIAAKRKDIISGLYGGDVTRKMKKLNHQKMHAKKMAARSFSGVKVDQETLLAAMGAMVE